MNIGIITQEGELVVPPFEQALAGCTLKRLLYLVQEVNALSQELCPFSPYLWLTIGAQTRKSVCAKAKVNSFQTLKISFRISFNMPM